MGYLKRIESYVKKKKLNGINVKILFNQILFR